MAARPIAIKEIFGHSVETDAYRCVRAASLPTLQLVAVRRFNEQGVDAEVRRSLIKHLMMGRLCRRKKLSNKVYEQTNLYAELNDFKSTQTTAVQVLVVPQPGMCVSFLPMPASMY